MDIMAAIQDRRSIRKYQPKEIESEKRNLIAEAFRLAPSARNLQNWQLLWIEDLETKEKIRHATLGHASMIAEAPAVLVAVGFSQEVMTCGHRVDSVDLSIAMSFVMLEAHSVGLGTCWMGSFIEEDVIKALNLPKGTSVAAISPIGYPDEAPDARPRKALEETFKVI